ncbi:MAG: hypothetical protein HRF50_16325 [Phycisphaerae bacterium]
MPRSADHRRPLAFTLVEVLLVVGLVGLLAVLVWPDFSAETRLRYLEESARRFKTTVAMCRAEAMNEACRYRLVFRQDGTLRLLRQADPIDAPHVYIRAREDWARLPILLDDVWVEAVALLANGTAPIRIDEELIEFDEFEPELVSVQDLESPIEVEFLPDGTSGSITFVLRNRDGRGRQLTLDGRLGGVRTETVETLESEAVRPDPIEDDYDPEAEARLLAELKNG